VVVSYYLTIRRHLARLRSASALAIGCLPLAVIGCHASVSGDSTGRTRQDSEQGPEDFDKPLNAQALVHTANGESSGDLALLGARQDFSLVTEHASTACACLKVALGSPSSAAFKWQNNLPRLDEDKQLALALSSDMPCKGEPKGSSGASYWGYRISGNDVIVFVEGARAGRPRAGAAIIPKPVADGQVYVAPAKRNYPYGRSLDGKDARCKVGNAASKRNTPFTASELGDTSYSIEPSGEE
jgi:hypothetical protein